MEKIEPIIKILDLVLASGYIRNAFPLSCLVVAGIGAGKTQIVKQYVTAKGVTFLTDVTAFGITKNLYSDIKTKRVKHIIIPDLIAPLSKSKSTVNTFIAFMNSLIEEGIMKIATFSITIEEPMKCGLISCIAKEDLFDRRHGWQRIGFMSRMIPVSYSYSKTDVIEILKTLFRTLKDEDESKLKLPRCEKEIKISDQFHSELLPYAITFSEAEKTYPFRRMKQLDILAMSNALLNNRTEVIKEDLETVIDLLKYINLDFNVL